MLDTAKQQLQNLQPQVTKLTTQSNELKTLINAKKRELRERRDELDKVRAKLTASKRALASMLTQVANNNPRIIDGVKYHIANSHIINSQRPESPTMSSSTNATRATRSHTMVNVQSRTSPERGLDINGNGKRSRAFAAFDGGPGHDSHVASPLRSKDGSLQDLAIPPLRAPRITAFLQDIASKMASK